MGAVFKLKHDLMDKSDESDVCSIFCITALHHSALET